uniref:Immunoglobulin domain-containing protein n=1 Tax=Cyprinus carpio TaxID=7962 RepID=A0A8C1MBI4_CYPCA
SGVFGVDAVKSESVTEGESVTLNPDVNTINEIQWSFIHNNNTILIALINRQTKKRTFYDDALGGRFKGRLKLDQTGSLTIRDTRTTDSGLYEVTSTSTEKPLNTFNLTVYARLPVPDISRSSQNSSSSQQNCSLLCSAVNCLDDSYSCVLNNPISNQTQHLNTELCHPCAGHPIHCCGFTEAVIRLALSALVGVAAVAVLVYDIRSRSLQQKRNEQVSPSNS